MEEAGLMDIEQYRQAEQELINWMQLIKERENGNVGVVLSQSELEESDEDTFDDPSFKTNSTERDKVLEEYRIYCNLCKKNRNRPRSYVGLTVKLYPIEMGKVATRGEDIRSVPPFVRCNLADFIGDDGRFDLVGFLKLQKKSFPTLFKLAVCIASVRTNEVGCERFFSMAGYVSCPRRTRLNVRNYECLSTLRSNMQKVYIDEKWVVEKYLMMEKTKAWVALEADDDLRVLELERELHAETLGVGHETLPPIVVDEETVELE
jgi:hypothetical protein